MSLKRSLGLDLFDLVIQVGITGMFMIMADSAAGSDSEGAIAAVVAISLGILAWRRHRALKSQGPFSTGEVQAERLREVEDRLTELESQQLRVMELEERLDFHERMLTQQRERDQIGRGS